MVAGPRPTERPWLLPAKSSNFVLRPSSLVISNRDFSLDHIIVGLHATVGGVEKPRRR